MLPLLNVSETTTPHAAVIPSVASQGGLTGLKCYRDKRTTSKTMDDAFCSGTPYVSNIHILVAFRCFSGAVVYRPSGGTYTGRFQIHDEQIMQAEARQQVNASPVTEPSMWQADNRELAFIYSLFTRLGKCSKQAGRSSVPSHSMRIAIAGIYEGCQ